MTRALVVMLCPLALACNVPLAQGTWRLEGTLRDVAPGGTAVDLARANVQTTQPQLQMLQLDAFGCSLQFHGTSDEGPFTLEAQRCESGQPLRLPKRPLPVLPMVVYFERGDAAVSGGVLTLQLYGRLGEDRFRVDAHARLVRR